MSNTEQAVKGCASMLMIIGILGLVFTIGIMVITGNVTKRVQAQRDIEVAQAQVSMERYRQRGETWREFWRQLAHVTVSVVAIRGETERSALIETEITKRTALVEEGLTERQALVADVELASYRFPFWTSMGIVWSFVVSSLLLVKALKREEGGRS